MFVKLLREKLVGNTVCKAGEVVEVTDDRLFKSDDGVSRDPKVDPAGVKHGRPRDGEGYRLRRRPDADARGSDR